VTGADATGDGPSPEAAAIAMELGTGALSAATGCEEADITYEDGVMVWMVSLPRCVFPRTRPFRNQQGSNRTLRSDQPLFLNHTLTPRILSERKDSLSNREAAQGRHSPC
jgi:hypothetical protein